MSELEDPRARLRVLQALQSLPRVEAERLAESDRPQERAQVARLASNESLLNRLAVDTSPAVRSHAARNTHTPLATLVRLARDPDESTRDMARHLLDTRTDLHHLKHV